MSWVNQTVSSGLFHFNLTITGLSPFNTSSLAHGKFNASHTTNATLIYTPQSIPTPWLVLTFGYAFSFIGYVGDIYKFFSHGDEYGIPKPTSLKTYAKLIHTCYSAYRIIASVRKAVLSMHNPLIPTQDLYQAEFLANALSHITFIDVFYNRPQLNKWIKLIFSVISFLVAIPVWQAALRVVRRDEQYYSRWSLVGGNCPLPVGSCQHLEYIGCGLNATTGIAPKDPNIINTANYLRIWEYIGAIGVFIVWPFLIIAMLVSFGGVIMQWLVEPRASWTPLPTGQQPLSWEMTKYGGHISARAGAELANREQSQEWGELYKAYSPHFIYGLIVQAVPALVLTALQQQKPKPIYIVDSFGPLVKAPVLLAGQNYTGGGNGTSWSDCFQIHAPADKWGFLDYWVNSTDIVQKIALL